jgi:hypothetical protein
MAAEGAQADGAHLAPEVLADYSSGQVTGEQRRRVQSHLAVCSECAQVVLDLAIFPHVEPLTPEFRRTEAEEAEDWLAIRKRLAARTAAPEPERRLPPAVREADPWWRAWVHLFLPSRAFAAGLLLAAAGVVFWVVRLQWPAWGGGALQANIFVQDLIPVSSSRTRDSIPGGTLSVHPAMERVVLILNSSDFRPFDDYEIQVVGEGGTPNWSRRGLVRNQDGSFSIEALRSSLPAGEYRIELYGLSKGSREPLSTYRFKVVYDSAAGPGNS